VLLISCSLYLYPHSNQLQTNSGNIKNLARESIKLLVYCSCARTHAHTHTHTLTTDTKECAMFIHLTARFLFAPVPICYWLYSSNWVGLRFYKKSPKFEVQCTAYHTNNTLLPLRHWQCFQCHQFKQAFTCTVFQFSYSYAPNWFENRPHKYMHTYIHYMDPCVTKTAGCG